jgi:hypothetical protein
MFRRTWSAVVLSPDFPSLAAVLQSDSLGSSKLARPSLGHLEKMRVSFRLVRRSKLGYDAVVL